jgi:hypothetical protein
MSVTDPAVNPDDYSKSELKTAAEVVPTVEPESGDTKADLAEKLTEATSVATPAVPLNQFTRRSGDEAIEGEWVDVVDGEYKGRFGYVAGISETGKDGYPVSLFVRTRDADNLLIEVAYANAKPSDSNGGR